MSSYSNDLEERRRLSKVTFSSISSDVLCVRIRKVSSEVREEDIPSMASGFTPISKIPGDHGKNKSRSTSIKTDSHKTASTSSQATPEEKNAGECKSGDKHDSTPCLRHAAENISRKAKDIPSEKISLCNNCSKSMLSYIFVVQDFLDSLAKEISGTGTSDCLQCARQDVRNSIASYSEKDSNLTAGETTSRMHSELKHKEVAESRSGGRRTSRPKTNRQDSKRNEEHQRSSFNPLSSQGHTNEQRWQREFTFNVTPPSNPIHDDKVQNLSSTVREKHIVLEQPESQNQHSCEQQTVENRQNRDQQWNASDDQNTKHKQQWIESNDQNTNQQWIASNEHNTNQQNQQWIASDNQNTTQKETHSVSNESMNRIDTKQQEYPMPHSSGPSQQTDGQLSEKPIFRAPIERAQPNYEVTHPAGSVDHYQNEPSNVPESPSLYREDVDGIISTLSHIDREIYDNARNRAGWEGMTEPAERLGLPSSNLIQSEAFVTSCRNNAEAVGCLVVGTSLLLCRTTRTLCVLVSEGVSSAFRGALSSVFQVVQYVRSLDSLGTTKLALLEQPELGITFEKLHIWRLIQFTKCVYLNPDTLVIQNCDELFCREELSAVPDIGWPDCFNSGVFVYYPSVHTFWQLLEFAEKQGSYDGGDQGLLNSYYNSWSSDISKKLSFIYNLMANVSYTYTPAFRRFGREVKIVQFHGSYKPWHVKFFSKSGQISPSSPVHPTYVQFVHIWLSIFRISVLRLMSQEIQSYAASQEVICAVEILRFFPLPAESEAEFFLTPPSVRLRLTEKKLTRSTSLPISEARRRKSAEFFRYTNPEEDIPETSAPQKVPEKGTAAVEKPKSQATGIGEDQDVEKLETSVSETDEVFKEAKTEEEKVIDENALPGAEVGNYQGMKAWEQGRMDYQGTDSSDNVIKRLQFLISKP